MASCTADQSAVHLHGEDAYAAAEDQAMRERLGDDKQRISQEMMACTKLRRLTRWAAASRC